jgi:hypothetical protein
VAHEPLIPGMRLGIFDLIPNQTSDGNTGARRRIAQPLQEIFG